MIDFRTIAVAAALIATPVLAAPVPPATDNIASVASSAVVDTQAQPRAKRYCLVETLTGTQIPRKICKTRAEWLDMGTDPTLS